MSGQEAAGLKIAIITSSFNDFITKRLYDGAVETLKQHGAEENNMISISVPGCFEIPLALAEASDRGYDAVICLGAVIRGETPHFDFVAGESARGIADISIKNRLPVGFGIITANTTEQAVDRAGGKRGNKGREAALAAIEMVKVISTIRENKR